MTGVQTCALPIFNNTKCTASGPTCFSTYLFRTGVTRTYYFTPSSDGTITSIQLSLNADGLAMAVSSAASTVLIDVRQGSTVLSTFSYSSLSSNVVTVTGTQNVSSGTQYSLVLYGSSGNVGYDTTLTNSAGSSWSFDNGADAGVSGQSGYPVLKATGSTSSATKRALAIVGNAVFGNGTGDTVTGLTTLSVSGTTTINTNTITTSSTQGYTGAVTLGANTTLTGTTIDRKSTRLNSSHIPLSRMPSSA